eukprot:238041_1
MASDSVNSAKVVDGSIVSADLSTGLTINTLTVTGTLDASTAEISGTSPLVFQGGSGSYTTTFAITEPTTSDKTITFPDASGTVVITGSTDTVNSVMIVDNTVSLADMASDSVNSAKIVDSSIALADMGPGSVGSSQIIDGSITTADISDNAVDKAKIHSNVAGTGLAQNTDGSLEIGTSRKKRWLANERVENKKKRKLYAGTKLFLENIPPNWRKSDIIHLMGNKAKILRVLMLKKRKRGIDLQNAAVFVSSAEEALDCMKLFDNKPICGHVVRVRPGKQKPHGDEQSSPVMPNMHKAGMANCTGGRVSGGVNPQGAGMKQQPAGMNGRGGVAATQPQQTR